MKSEPVHNKNVILSIAKAHVSAYTFVCRKEEYVVVVGRFMRYKQKGTVFSRVQGDGLFRQQL